MREMVKPAMRYRTRTAIEGEQPRLIPAAGRSLGDQIRR